MVETESADGEQAQAAGGGVDRLAERPIHGQTLLRIEDFKSAWLALPTMRLVAVWLGAGLLLWPVFVWSGSSEGFQPSYLLQPILIVALGYGLFRGRSRWAEAALKVSGGDAVEYLFDANGYQVKASGSESRWSWEKLHRHLETKEAFLIYYTPQLINVVPKRAFAAGDQARLREELAARIPRRKPRSVGKILLVWAVLIIAFLATWQLAISPSVP